jgi:hypothetical protein
MREREGGEPSPWCRALDAPGITIRDLARVLLLLSVMAPRLGLCHLVFLTGARWRVVVLADPGPP